MVEFNSQYIKPHSDPPLNGALLFKWYNYNIMPRDHFSKVMHSPYFQSSGYKDTPSGKAEQQMINKLNKISNFFKRLIRKK